VIIYTNGNSFLAMTDGPIAVERARVTVSAFRPLSPRQC
jgi:hypothetical protein